jgi:hypothetical protein
VTVQPWGGALKACFAIFLRPRQKTMHLMFIHKHLPPQARKELKKVGGSKGIELAKIERRDRQDFDCATWLHKARELPKEEFKQEVERELSPPALSHPTSFLSAGGLVGLNFLASLRNLISYALIRCAFAGNLTPISGF